MRLVHPALGLLIAAVVAFAPGLARAEWLKAESEHFVIYGDTNEGEIREYARKVERFHAMLERFMPPKHADIVAPKLAVYITDGLTDMRQIWPDMPDTVGGFYSRSYDGIYAVSDRRRGSGDTTLFHEYAHHYMYQHQNEAYPGWFVEGFAEYFAPSDMRMGQIRYGLWRDGRIASLTQSAWLPMEDVLRSRLVMGSATRGAAYYAQAWLLTHYMLGSPERNSQMGAYLGAVVRGADPIEALSEHVGTTPEQLTRDLRSYLGRGITVYRLSEALPVAEVEVSRLPRSARDALWLRLRATRTVSEADRPALLAQARAVADRHPGDLLANLTLARVQHVAKDATGAQATLDGLIAAHPEDPEARLLMATLLMDRADDAEDAAESLALKRQAQRHLGVAYQADPMDFRIYRALTRNRRGAAGYPNESDFQTLQSAYALAPQLAANGVDYAQVLMTLGRPLEAVVVLSPLANNPHGGSGQAALRERLDEARVAGGLPAIGGDGAPPEAEEPAEAAGDDEGGAE